MALVVAALLIVANGLFVAVEFAILASVASRIEDEAATGSLRGRMSLRSIRDVNHWLAGAQLGITLASLALGAVAEPAIAHALHGPLEDLGLSTSGSELAALIIALSIVVFLHLVIGEMVPKGIAIAAPERTLLALSVPMGAFMAVFRLLIWLLNAVASLIIRLFGIEAADEISSSATPGEFEVMLARSREEGLLDADEHELLVGALGFADRCVGDAMISRDQIDAVPSTALLSEIEDLIRTSGHSRIVVYRQDLDEVLGFVHSKDLLRYSGGERSAPLPRAAIRVALSVTIDVPLGELLLAMRRARRHVAIVSAEDGSTLGMITMEDVLEEIVGHQDAPVAGRSGVE